jgi:tRNA nucleotidyltransferase (CCA-adding enzyme)
LSPALTLVPSAVATQKSALSPATWPFNVSLLPDHAYLVGGSVRDALLHRQADYLDLDFVLPENAVETARQIAQTYHAGFVVLDVEHQIARVVFRNATVDFAQQIGPSIHGDLQRRDFTINAIAYDPHTETLLDPLDGCTDLQRKTLCMVAPQNLQEDPLRLLRAYRQAAQLGFALDVETQHTIRTLSPLIAQVAAERVRGELDCLLSMSAGTPLLSLAWQDGVLHPWLPMADKSALLTLVKIDRVMAQLPGQWPDYARLLHGWVKERSAPGLHRSWIKATKLSQLLGDDTEQAETTLVSLKYSRAEQQAVLNILKAWQFLQRAVATNTLSLSNQYRLFKAAGEGFVGVAVVGLVQGLPPGVMQTLMERYLDPQDMVAHSQPLVSGRDLIAGLQLSPGPQIGELLEAIHLAQAEGIVTTRAEAMEWAQGQLESTSTSGNGASSFP